jgi:hypothetical protein
MPKIIIETDYHRCTIDSIADRNVYDSEIEELYEMIKQALMGVGYAEKTVLEIFGEYDESETDEKRI